MSPQSCPGRPRRIRSSFLVAAVMAAAVLMASGPAAPELAGATEAAGPSGGPGVEESSPVLGSLAPGAEPAAEGPASLVSAPGHDAQGLAAARAGTEGTPAETGGAQNCAPRVSGLRLSRYPATAEYPALAKRLTPAPEVIDALARDYANRAHVSGYGTITTGAPNMQDFLLLHVPLWLYGVSSGTAKETYGLDVSRPADLSRLMWISHVASYYGGVWLRQNFNEFEGKLVPGIPFANQGMEQYYRNFYDELRGDVLSADPDTVLAATRSTVRSPLVNKLSGLDSTSLIAQVLPPTDNVGSFGYDAAWLQNILPPSLNAPLKAKPRVANLFSHDPGALLDARFGIPEQPFLVSARVGHDRARAAGGAAGARYEEIVRGKGLEMPLQLSQGKFDLLGSAVYAIGVPTATSYRFFDQEQYDRVLTWATYAIMFNQATSMRALTAYATRDVALARGELRATLVWATYVGGYVWGHLNPAIDGRTPMADLLPTFTTTC